MAGWEGGDVQSRFTTRVDLSFYPARDIELAAGYRYVGGNSALALRSEWLTPKPTSFTPPGGARLALFAEARIGEHQYTGAWGGLRLYFGQSQTLIDKHRRDDPLTDPNVDNLISIKTQVNKLNNLNEAAKPTSYPSDRRLKRDIILLAKLENGIGIYRYRYLWSDVVYVGVMAQEVAQIVPDAVVPMDNGYLSVDYDRLGLRIMTWNAWIRNPSIEEYPLAA
jgi:hypothetical protein